MTLKGLFRSSEAGTSLIEILIVTVLIGVSALAAAGLFEQMLRSSNFLEFQSKKEQLRLAMLSQVLSTPIHCRCIFAGASQFPAAGVTQLAGFTAPTALGRYLGNCAGGVIAPFVTTAGLDGLTLNSVNLEDVTQIGTAHSGKLVIRVSSGKQVLGPQMTTMKIDVDVTTTPGSPGNVTFDACSVAAPVGAPERVQGIPVGAPITYSTTTNNSTTSLAYVTSAYPGALAISYNCTTSCRDSGGTSHVIITFRNGGTPIYSATPCRTAEITSTNTSWDRRTGILPIPALATDFLVDGIISSCDNGNESIDFSLQVMK